jgi:hypothetical protein
MTTLRYTALVFLFMGCGDKYDPSTDDSADTGIEVTGLCADGTNGNLSEDDVPYTVFVDPSAQSTDGDGSLEAPYATVLEAYAEVTADDGKYIIFVGTGSLHEKLSFSVTNFPEDSDPQLTLRGCGPDETEVSWDEASLTTDSVLWGYELPLEIYDISMVGGGETTIYIEGYQTLHMENVRVSQLTVEGNDTGILIDQAEATLVDVEVFDTRYGIYVTGRQPISITSANIHDTSIGIWGNSVDDLTITDPLIADLGSVGILIQDGSNRVTVSGGSISDVFDAGIWAYGVYNLVVESIDIQGVSGVYGGQSMNTLADGIRVFQAHDDGFNPAGFMTSLSDITISDVDRTGVLVSAASLNSLTDVVVSGAAYTRVSADGGEEVGIILQNGAVVDGGIDTSLYSVIPGDDLLPVTTE